ncbi:MAG TPA: type II toxin-antitoxin system RelE/ParE family toxin [Candidatus Cybelea sp.]|jgi:proteic killer suppression protein|nr:type II toxin-antitoxin system RelE/ParE family toxin [Candidatus Cybelea sp.]
MQIRDRGTLAIFNGINSKAARRTLPQSLHARAAGLMDRLNAALSPNDFRAPAGNHLEKLSGDRAGQLSISINDQYRICFTWNEGEAQNVEIVDYH